MKRNLLNLKANCCCCFEPQRVIESEEAQRISDLFEMAAHPVRLQILHVLAGEKQPVCVCDLQSLLPIKQPTVSHHLRLLLDAGFLQVERRGIWAFYSIRPEPLRRLKEHLSTLLTPETD